MGSISSSWLLPTPASPLHLNINRTWSHFTRKRAGDQRETTELSSVSLRTWRTSGGPPKLCAHYHSSEATSKTPPSTGTQVVSYVNPRQLRDCTTLTVLTIRTHDALWITEDELVDLVQKMGCLTRLTVRWAPQDFAETRSERPGRHSIELQEHRAHLPRGRCVRTQRYLPLHLRPLQFSHSLKGVDLGRTAGCPHRLA